MATFDNDAFDTDAFDTDSFDLDENGNQTTLEKHRRRRRRCGFMVIRLSQMRR